ncbi:MAG: potassium transporter [Deltaproteobacteria bacterium]|nr:potassium transporter [Deltaproteobacteria bacterium]
MSTSVTQPQQRDVPAHFPPAVIRVLGAGRFGRIAAERLARRFPRADFLVVDMHRERLEPIERELGLPVLQGDAVPFLLSAPLAESDWIIPAVPLHVAFGWVLGHLARRFPVKLLPVPEVVDGQVPNPFRTESGTLYASFATFRCPDNCSEPDAICTHTKEPRKANLFEVLENVRANGYRVVVVRSHQLAPGVGGYPVEALRDKLSEILREPGRWIVATSCRCHAVVDALNWGPP